MTAPASEDQTIALSPMPVRRQERIVAVDVLRGVAALGLMAVHILIFSQPVDPLGNPGSILPYEGMNRVYVWLTSVLVFGKFHFLFAMLFGASVIFFDRKTAGRRLREGAGLWYRRMGWLAAIGLAHGIFLFYGDILFLYAVCGMVILWWVRTQGPGALLGIAAAFYAIGLLLFGGLMLLSYFFIDHLDRDEFIASQLEAYNGTYLDAMRFTASMYLTNTLMMIPFVTFWLTTAIMLFGMALTKLGVVTAHRSTSFYAWLAVVGLGVGLPLSAGMFAWVEQGDFAPARTFTWLSLFSPLAVPMALGYLGVVMLMVKLHLLRPAQTAVAAVGRMALSNYLLHSLCGVVIFHGWGIDLYGKLQFPELFYIVLGVWALNIAFSVVWLRLCRFGPVEWLWRSLTYKELQPMRLT